MFSLGLATAVYRNKKGGITADALAKKLHVSRSLVALMEAGRRLPPLKNEFIEAVSDFLEVPKTDVLGSVACEHFFASVKDLAWLPSLFCQAISMRFTEDYLIEEEENGVTNVIVLAPADSFRAPLLQELLTHLHPVAGDFYPLEKEIILPRSNDSNKTINKTMPVIGKFKNVKPFLYKSESLFPLRDSLIFMDTFGLFNGSFYFTWHSPFSFDVEDKCYSYLQVIIDPYSSTPIKFMMPPVPPYPRYSTR